MPRRQRKTLSFSPAETISLIGSVCPCGTCLPLWEWAKQKAIAEGKTCRCATDPSQEDWSGNREIHTPLNWAPKMWGVKQIVVNTGQSRWYTNDRHRPEEAEDLARHYTEYTSIDPLTGMAVLYRPFPLLPGDRHY